MERTHWWYMLVGIAALNVVWSLAGVLSGDRITTGPATLWIFLGGSILLLTPMFYYALYRDTGVVGDDNSSWTPNRRAWIGGGVLVSTVGFVVFLNPLIHYITGLYLVRRYRKSSVTELPT
ncbi:hypothetical protein [Haladaptatus sp. AB643]|uniref:hypothetical protein n=1 Tax=Haladaptatus sp. AB643 TaxID=2934174 RepID=UPI00209BC25C|nr:hypothetical protein [Haladaptatus sp. AB643]MCO8243778.1 hypothetical protein [Haladaptatus sp. AB643]